MGDWACRRLGLQAEVFFLSLAEPSSLGALQVGEDVPDARKCACASHVAKVAEFFQVCGDWVPRGQGQVCMLGVVMRVWMPPKCCFFMEGC